MRMTVMLIVMLTSGSAVTCSADDKKDRPAPKSPELQVLDRFVGTWDTEVTITSDGKDTKLKGMTKADWTLGGRQAPLFKLVDSNVRLPLAGTVEGFRGFPMECALPRSLSMPEPSVPAGPYPFGGGQNSRALWAGS